MGPSSHYSQGSKHPSSISLNSRASVTGRIPDECVGRFPPVNDKHEPWNALWQTVPMGNGTDTLTRKSLQHPLRSPDQKSLACAARV